MVAAGERTIPITGLAASTSYKVYVAAEDTAGNVVDAALTSAFTTLPKPAKVVVPPKVVAPPQKPTDTQGPTLTGASVIEAAAFTATISAASNEAGRLYWVVQPKSAPAINVADFTALRNNQPKNSAMAWGTTNDVEANSDTKIVILDLSPGISYAAFVFAEDQSGNLVEAPRTLFFDTRDPSQDASYISPKLTSSEVEAVQATAAALTATTAVAVSVGVATSSTSAAATSASSAAAGGGGAGATALILSMQNFAILSKSAAAKDAMPLFSSSLGSLKFTNLQFEGVADLFGLSDSGKAGTVKNSSNTSSIGRRLFNDEQEGGNGTAREASGTCKSVVDSKREKLTGIKDFASNVFVAMLIIVAVLLVHVAIVALIDCCKEQKKAQARRNSLRDIRSQGAAPNTGADADSKGGNTKRGRLSKRQSSLRKIQGILDENVKPMPSYEIMVGLVLVAGLAESAPAVMILESEFHWKILAGATLLVLLLFLLAVSRIIWLRLYLADLTWDPAEHAWKDANDYAKKHRFADRFGSLLGAYRDRGQGTYGDVAGLQVFTVSKQKSERVVSRPVSRLVSLTLADEDIRNHGILDQCCKPKNKKGQKNQGPRSCSDMIAPEWAIVVLLLRKVLGGLVIGLLGFAPVSQLILLLILFWTEAAVLAIFVPFLRRSKNYLNAVTALLQGVLLMLCIWPVPECGRAPQAVDSALTIASLMVIAVQMINVAVLITEKGVLFYAKRKKKKMTKKSATVVPEDKNKAWEQAPGCDGEESKDKDTAAVESPSKKEASTRLPDGRTRLPSLKDQSPRSQNGEDTRNSFVGAVQAVRALASLQGD